MTVTFERMVLERCFLTIFHSKFDFQQLLRDKVFKIWHSKNFEIFWGSFLKIYGVRGVRTGFYFWLFWDPLTFLHPNIKFLEMAFFVRVK